MDGLGIAWRDGFCRDALLSPLAGTARAENMIRSDYTNLPHSRQQENRLFSKKLAGAHSVTVGYLSRGGRRLTCRTSGRPSGLAHVL
jgi:hypothetical protein